MRRAQGRQRKAPGGQSQLLTPHCLCYSYKPGSLCPHVLSPKRELRLLTPRDSMASAHEAPRPGPPNPATAPSRDVTLSLLGSHLFAFSLGFALLIAVLGHCSGRLLLLLLPVLLLLLFGAFGSAWGWRGSLFAPYPGRGTSRFTRDTHASPGPFPQPQGSNPSSLLQRNKKGEDPVLRPHGLFKWASRCPQVFQLENLLLTPSRPHPPLHSDN